MMEYTYAYCWLSGIFEFGRQVPDGALAIARAPKGSRKLRTAVSTWATHDHETNTLLVPGMPAALNPYHAIQAFRRFADLVDADLPREEGQPS